MVADQRFPLLKKGMVITMNLFCQVYDLCFDLLFIHDGALRIAVADKRGEIGRWWVMIPVLSTYASDTVSLTLPLALLRLRTFLPLAVAIRERKPCLFFLFLTEG